MAFPEFKSYQAGVPIDRLVDQGTAHRPLQGDIDLVKRRLKDAEHDHAQRFKKERK
jgi:hypothetical protein